MVLEVFGAGHLAIKCSSWRVAGDSREEACTWAGRGMNRRVNGEGEGHLAYWACGSRTTGSSYWPGLELLGLEYLGLDFGPVRPRPDGPKWAVLDLGFGPTNKI